jgi:hypothetical protein
VTWVWIPTVRLVWGKELSAPSAFKRPQARCLQIREVLLAQLALKYVSLPTLED